MPALALRKLSSWPAAPAKVTFELDAASEAILPLPLPISDDRGGLFESMKVRWVAPCSVQKSDNCARKPRLFVQYEGRRLVDLPSPKAKGW